MSANRGGATLTAKPLRIGMIGLDNPRVVSFAKLLHNEGEVYPIGDAQLTVAWPGIPSPDFSLSAKRLDGYVAELRDQQGVAMLNSLEEVAEQCDAWMLEAVDGRTRAALFAQMVPYGKPIFVDKPFALDAVTAEEMIKLAAAYGTPWMSCSALRYAMGLTSGLQSGNGERPKGADFYGPMGLEPTQAGYFWYGIHTAEMLFRALGIDCVEVHALRTADHDVVTGVWQDGRVGVIRGNRTGNEAFGGVLHWTSSSQPIEVKETDKSYLASLLEEVVSFLASGRSPIDPKETLAIMRFLEAANRSLAEQTRIKL